MTIAICFVTLEGVVFGADSTSTEITIAGGDETYVHLNHQQKVFEIGEGGTVGLVHWGMYTFGSKSLRTLLAELNDWFSCASRRPETVAEIASHWAETINQEYDKSIRSTRYKDKIERFRALDKRKALQDLPVAERIEWLELRNLMVHLEVGYFIGGYVDGDRTPRAFEVRLSPVDPHVSPVELETGYRVAGETKFADRLLDGLDYGTKRRIAGLLPSATADEKIASIVDQVKIRQQVLPIREAIDLVHWLIHATIKGIKFSAEPQTCGGPIEIALVSSDRRWRWIRHKNFESAINDGVPQ